MESALKNNPAFMIINIGVIPHFSCVQSKKPIINIPRAKDPKISTNEESPVASSGGPSISGFHPCANYKTLFNKNNFTNKIIFPNFTKFILLL